MKTFTSIVLTVMVGLVGLVAWDTGMSDGCLRPGGPFAQGYLGVAFAPLMVVTAFVAGILHNPARVADVHDD